MAAISLHKYKISISEESKHTQGLQVGDIVRRQYKDGNNIIYSLMCVTETGSESGREYFIGVLLDGDAPSTGQVLDFVRVTNLYNANRLGALYLTASDESAPYMDVIDGIAVEQSLCYPVSNNDYSYEDGFAQYVIQGKDHLKSTSYTQSGLGNIRRICDITFKSSAVSSDSYVGISQDIDDNLKVGEVVLIGFHIKANRALTGAKLLFEYQDHSVSDAEITIPRIPASDYVYMVFAVSVDNSAAYKRNMTIDFRNANIQEDDSVSIANLNIIRLSSVANFKGGTKARVGKLNGIVDEVFGSLHDYGVYSQRFFASKAVNIAGTLTAGDENGSGATFYAGKIHKNVFIDSLNLSGCSGYTAISNESPTGLGKSVTGTALVFEAQTKAWADAHKGIAYTLSFYAKSSNADYITIYQGEDTLGGIRIEADDSWHRYSFTFNLMEYDGNEDLAFTLSAESSVTISSLQLETGKYVTQYQATDTTLSYSDEYGAWFCRGGVGGTIQNPLLRFSNDGSISSRGDLFHINADGTGYFVGGAFTWNAQGIQLRQLVLTWDQLDSSIKNRIESAGTEWVADWNKTATTIGENYIVTPKIFAGTVTNNKMTGVYLGQLSTTEAGIYGFDDGNRIFFIDKTGAEIGGWSITSVGLQSPTGRMHILSTGSIKAAYGDTTYWEIRENGSASFAQGNVLLNADGSASFTGSITAASGAIGGWNIGSDRLTSMNIAMNTTNRYIAVVNKTMITGEENDLNYLTSVRALGGVAMYYTSSADWGLIGYNSIGQTFSLGSTNKIGCWYFDDGALWSGAKVDTLASYAGTNNITIGGNGIRSQGWYLDKDGAVAFGHGTALFRANGSGYIANQNIVWGAGGDVTLGGGTSGFNLDGSGWVADHAISWNANGDVTFSNAVRLSFQGMVTASVIDNVLGDSAVLAATTNSITAKIQEAANGNPNLLENADLFGFGGFLTNGALVFPKWGENHADYVASGQSGAWEHDMGVGLGSWDYYGHQTAYYHGEENLNSKMTYCEWLCQEITDKLEPDTWYTFSFMLSGTANCEALQTWVYPNVCSEYSVDDSVVVTSGVDPSYRWTAGAWKRHTIKFKTRMVLDTTTPIKLLFRIQPQTSAEFFIYVSQIKLEKGENCTAWNNGNLPKKLLATGIDIQKGIISMVANNFRLCNNAGEYNLFADQYGNLTVRGNVSANSFVAKEGDLEIKLTGRQFQFKHDEDIKAYFELEHDEATNDNTLMLYVKNLDGDGNPHWYSINFNYWQNVSYNETLKQSIAVADNVYGLSNLDLSRGGTVRFAKPSFDSTYTLNLWNCDYSDSLTYSSYQGVNVAKFWKITTDNQQQAQPIYFGHTFRYIGTRVSFMTFENDEMRLSDIGEDINQQAIVYDPDTVYTNGSVIKSTRGVLYTTFIIEISIASYEDVVRYCLDNGEDLAGMTEEEFNNYMSEHAEEIQERLTDIIGATSSSMSSLIPNCSYVKNGVRRNMIDIKYWTYFFGGIA